jgi:hypothetical protein
MTQLSLRQIVTPNTTCKQCVESNGTFISCTSCAISVNTSTLTNCTSCSACSSSGSSCTNCNTCINPTLGSKYFSDWIGFGTILVNNVTAGKYEMFVQYAWPTINNSTQPNNIAQDFTIRVYAAEAVVIFDNNDIANSPYTHNNDFWPSLVKSEAAEAKYNQLLNILKTF